MSTRPVILGMNNPISSAPEHALYPHPPGCTGHRLWMMLNARTGASKLQYLRAFERHNLVEGKTWTRERAHRNADAFVEKMQGRVILILGEQVRIVLGIPRLLVHPQELRGATWRQLPHPSRRNLWYNDPECRAVAGALLAELYALANVRENA